MDSDSLEENYNFDGDETDEEQSNVQSEVRCFLNIRVLQVFDTVLHWDCIVSQKNECWDFIQIYDNRSSMFHAIFRKYVFFFFFCTPICSSIFSFLL